MGAHTEIKIKVWFINNITINLGGEREESHGAPPLNKSLPIIFINSYFISGGGLVCINMP